MRYDVILSLALAVLVVLAGCTGGLGSDTASGPGQVDDSSTDDGSDAETGSDGDGGAGDRDGTDEATGDGHDLESGAWEPFAFDRPGTYVFSIYSVDEGEGTLVWDVQEVSDDSVTVAIDYELGGDSYSSTITGDADTVYGQTLTTPAGGVTLMSVFSPGMWGGEELEVGAHWSYAVDGESMSFEVTEIDTVGGVDCYRSEMHVNDVLTYESCVSPDLGLALHSAHYDEDGTLVFEMELVEYEAR